jgi:membrane-associated PAP2 superfamily phosphatase
MHVGVKYLAWAAFGVLAMGFWRPLPFMRRLTPREHAWWIGTTLLCVALIALLKRVSVTSCPWDLVEFGGALARHVPHWALGQCDGGPGRCFPSAHASCAFAFLSVPFVLRRTAPVAATRMATLIVAAGLVFGWVQMMRGAHYASHTLWTGWFCWCISALSFHASRVWLDGTAARPRCAGCPAGSTVSSRQATPLHGSVMLSRRDATPLDHNARRPDPADTHATVARRRRQDDRGDRS